MPEHVARKGCLEKLGSTFRASLPLEKSGRAYDSIGRIGAKNGHQVGMLIRNRGKPLILVLYLRPVRPAREERYD